MTRCWLPSSIIWQFPLNKRVVKSVTAISRSVPPLKIDGGVLPRPILKKSRYGFYYKLDRPRLESSILLRVIALLGLLLLARAALPSHVRRFVRLRQIESIYHGVGGRFWSLCGVRYLGRPLGLGFRLRRCPRIGSLAVFGANVQPSLQCCPSSHLIGVMRIFGTALTYSP